MSTIFISHSSKDNDFARELESQLNRQHHSSVFLDFEPDKGIVAGQSWEQTLYRKLRACRAVIALCTDEYLMSHWCFAEIALARMEGKPIFALKIDPLSTNAKLPSILGENQYIDMRNDPAGGYLKLWRGLGEIDLLGVVGEWNPNESPYLGLAAFHEKHAALFFGREEESRSGIELLERGSPNLIMILGASGSGKSSLARAGILPRLRRSPDRWLIVEPLRPGTNPFLELADAMVRSYRRYAADSADRTGTAEQLAQRLQAWSALETGTTNEQKEPNSEHTLGDDERVGRLLTQLEELQKQPPSNAQGPFLKFLDWSLQDLQRICDTPAALSAAVLNMGPTILADLALDLRRVANRPHAKVLIFIDQFEELLDAKRQHSQLDDFMRLLRASIETDNSPLTILGTMRSDFLGVFQQQPELRGIDFDSLSLGPVRAEGMRKIIEEPAKLGAIELENGLTDRLLADTETPDALPLLSFTLWVMWRDFRQDGVLEIKEYESLGGLHGAIAREADALLNRKNELALHNAFLQMARLTDEGGYARQPVSWDAEELRPVHDLLEKFIERRLLFTQEQAGKRIVEVAHEALFRAWAPLRKWLRNHRAEFFLKQEIKREADAWIRRKRAKDVLWRGNRLGNALPLLKQGKLGDNEKAFIKAGLSRQRVRRVSWVSGGTVIFLGMMMLTWWAVLAERKTNAARDNLADQYRWMIGTLGDYIADLLPKGAHLGEIQVTTGNLALPDPKRRKNWLIQGEYQHNGAPTGRVLAVAHNGALSDRNPKSKIFLKNAIRWTAPELPTAGKIVFSAGHCEVVTNIPGAGWEEYRYPLNAIAEWGYTFDALKDLADSEALNSASLLIIGNAWGDFSEAEINGVRQFVANGGGLIMAGIHWSWREYKAPDSGFNPCSFAAESTGSSVAQDGYPMNKLGAAFGLKWVN